MIKQRIGTVTSPGRLFILLHLNGCLSASHSCANMSVCLAVFSDICVRSVFLSSHPPSLLLAGSDVFVF